MAVDDTEIHLRVLSTARPLRVAAGAVTLRVAPAQVMAASVLRRHRMERSGWFFFLLSYLQFHATRPEPSPAVTQKLSSYSSSAAHAIRKLEVALQSTAHWTIFAPLSLAYSSLLAAPASLFASGFPSASAAAARSASAFHLSFRAPHPASPGAFAGASLPAMRDRVVHLLRSFAHRISAPDRIFLKSLLYAFPASARPGENYKSRSPSTEPAELPSPVAREPIVRSVGAPGITGAAGGVGASGTSGIRAQVLRRLFFALRLSRSAGQSHTTLWQLSSLYTIFAQAAGECAWLPVIVPSQRAVRQSRGTSVLRLRWSQQSTVFAAGDSRQHQQHTSPMRSARPSVKAVRPEPSLPGRLTLPRPGQPLMREDGQRRFAVRALSALFTGSSPRTLVSQTLHVNRMTAGVAPASVSTNSYARLWSRFARVFYAISHSMAQAIPRRAARYPTAPGAAASSGLAQFLAVLAPGAIATSVLEHTRELWWLRTGRTRGTSNERQSPVVTAAAQSSRAGLPSSLVSGQPTGAASREPLLDVVPVRDPANRTWLWTTLQSDYYAYGDYAYHDDAEENHRPVPFSEEQRRRHRRVESDPFRLRPVVHYAQPSAGSATANGSSAPGISESGEVLPGNGIASPRGASANGSTDTGAQTNRTVVGAREAGSTNSPASASAEASVTRAAIREYFRGLTRSESKALIDQIYPAIEDRLRREKRRLGY